MSSPKSHSAPRAMVETERPYSVRVEVYEPVTGDIILSKDVESFEQLGEAVSFAQRVWKKFVTK